MYSLQDLILPPPIALAVFQLQYINSTIVKSVIYDFLKEQLPYNNELY